MPAQNTKQARTRRQMIREDGQPYEIREYRKSLREGRVGCVVNARVRGELKRRFVFKKYYFPEDAKQSMIAQRKVWMVLKSAGLPVVDIFRPITRERSKLFGTIIMNDLKRKYGKLYPINDEYGNPKFLSKLNAKDSLVRELASDLAVMHMNGIRPTFIDCWHFYKKTDGSWGRVLFDFEYVQIQPYIEKFFEITDATDGTIRRNINEFRLFLPRESFAEFEKAYKQTVYNSTRGHYRDAKAHEARMAKIRARLKSIFDYQGNIDGVKRQLQIVQYNLRKLKQ